MYGFLKLEPNFLVKIDLEVKVSTMRYKEK